MGYLRHILAIAIGAIAGMLVFGLTPAYQELLGATAAVVAIVAVYGVSALLLREEDRDPTMRPTNVRRSNGGGTNDRANRER